ncbi:pyridoxamine 5'-phosphate oxidase family protein [Natrialbaceae archaeon AArc-T1-2]|uniref:pyridoxamine 5'-phosphate oxidase family protein n=1 Tax=Natrialbaceae archaeon AArc-T1-2 TaxID=3053904 RepID=UPI00255B3A85|nr:pyridoxamine 5'-phosphate oxidase family protein [Natrialbaceae archaeon AArc-T1-2]WIV66083.1 pyridoxamine 5'-phosphate oxidase family protein [Natrialbaceae archaeon AArc-T1-2]
MQELRWVQMSDAEIDEFLGQGGTGVISFAAGTDDPPVTVPISYGYNEDVSTLYYRLSVPPDSKKAKLIDSNVTFVTYEKTDGRWQSVVATGTLEDAADIAYESSTIQGMWTVQIPEVDIFERPREEVTFRDFCLTPETLTGRKEVQSES